MSEKKHTLEIEDRSVMRLSGVEDVESFSEKIVVIRTSLGRLTVKGGGLLIKDLRTESGEMSISGTVDSLEYSRAKKPAGTVIRSLFG